MQVDSALIVNADGIFHPYELKLGPLKQQQQRLMKGAFDGDEGDRVSPQTALLISCWKSNGPERTTSLRKTQRKAAFHSYWLITRRAICDVLCVCS